MVFQEADLSVRVVRDIFSAHFERAIVDDDKQHQRLLSFFSRTAPELVDRVELWKDEDAPLFDAYGVDPIIEGMLSRRVDLPSGGYLMIDYAEALTVIDVNTGSFIGKGKQARLEDTITKTNLEAADEVVRQLRLRDIGGIIVIDFIDMARSRNRTAVLDTLRKALDEDRTKTFVVEISPLGLVEMTRQNVTDGVREIMTKPCPTCDGEGVVKSEETVAIEVERRLRDLAAEKGADGPEAYLIRIHPKVTACFTGDGGRMLEGLEAETGRFFHFEGSDGLALEHFSVSMSGSREEVMRQAVPFSEGDEVHVTLIEPHMFEADDAVAKIDGYVIDVVDGLVFVGEKKLVRIEDAGRAGARAVLLGEDAEQAAAAAEERRRSRERSRRAVRSRRPKAAPVEAPVDAPGVQPDIDAQVGGDSLPEPEDLLDGDADATPAGAEEDPGVQVTAAPDEGLADPEAEDGGDAEEGEDDEDGTLQSRPRRRGRRGGRRRSRAKGESEPDAAEVPEASE
jgi:ribonuclease G